MAAARMPTFHGSHTLPEDEAGTSEGTGLDCSSLAVPGVVPSVALPASGLPTPTSPLSLPTIEPTGSASPAGTGGNSPVSRLESVRHSLKQGALALLERSLSRVSTFERFYFKPTPSNNMGLLLVSL